MEQHLNIGSHKHLDRLDAQELRTVQCFEEGISQCAPYLFNLANQVNNDADEKDWNLIIGDDTSGRLVTRFLRDTLVGTGHELPVHYLRVSYANREHLECDSLHSYVDMILDQIEGEPRILVVSESAGTYTTLRYMRDLLGPKAAIIDFAILGVSEVPEDFQHTYIGGIGRDIAETVYKTFERTVALSKKHRAIDFMKRNEVVKRLAKQILPMKVRKNVADFSSSALTNLDGRAELDRPHAGRSWNQSHALTSRYCYRRISELAHEYSESRDKVLVS